MIRFTLSRIAGYQLRYGYSDKRVLEFQWKYQHWPLYNVGELPSKPGSLKVYFYQTLVDLKAPSDILYYKISLVFDGGVIMFVNGKEVYRQFLPISVTDSTGPTRNDLIGHQTIRFLPYYFIDGLNLISFEIHSTRSSTSDQFEMTIDVETSTNNCTNINFPSMYKHTPYPGNNQLPDLEDIPMAFDRNTNTKYFVRKGPPARFTVFFAEPYGFNKFVYSTGKDCCSRNPQTFDILGILKQPRSYMIMESFNDTNFLEKVTHTGSGSSCPNPDKVTVVSTVQTVPYEVNNKKAYYGYSFNLITVVKSNSYECGNGIQFSELEMHSCKIKKCPASGAYPEAFAGTEIVKQCNFGSSTVKYTCGDSGIWGTTGSCPGKNNITK